MQSCFGTNTEQHQPGGVQKYLQMGPSSLSEDVPEVSAQTPLCISPDLMQNHGRKSRIVPAGCSAASVAPPDHASLLQHHCNLLFNCSLLGKGSISPLSPSFSSPPPTSSTTRAPSAPLLPPSPHSHPQPPLPEGNQPPLLKIYSLNYSTDSKLCTQGRNTPWLLQQPTSRKHSYVLPVAPGTKAILQGDAGWSPGPSWHTAPLGTGLYVGTGGLPSTHHSRAARLLISWLHSSTVQCRQKSPLPPNCSDREITAPLVSLVPAELLCYADSPPAHPYKLCLGFLAPAMEGAPGPTASSFQALYDKRGIRQLILSYTA